MKKTPWFPGTAKPVHVGVYERTYPLWQSVYYARWDGKRWYCFCHSPAEAARDKVPSDYQKLPWRGLAEKP
jgi:hypothetical protein